MNVVVVGPNAEAKGWFTAGRERVRDAGGDWWPNVFLIGPNVNDVGGGTSADDDARIG